MSANSSPRSNESSYHHGDLRNALIVAAAELIESSGADDFAMIDAARRAGVSSAAPYRHFKDKEELLLSVGELGFYALDCELNRVAAQHERGSVDAIIALGQCYLRFVSERPAFFGLMWGEHGNNMFYEAELDYAQQENNGFFQLLGQVGAWCAKEDVTRTSPLEITMTLWSIGMGLCHLTFNRQMGRFAPEVDPYQLLENSGRRYLRGIVEEK